MNKDLDFEFYYYSENDWESSVLLFRNAGEIKDLTFRSV